MAVITAVRFRETKNKFVVADERCFGAVGGSYCVALYEPRAAFRGLWEQEVAGELSLCF